MRKNKKLRKGHEICNRQKPPPSFEKWMEEDKVRLKERVQLNIEMKDTALGCLEQNNKRVLKATLYKMTEKE